MTYSTPINVVFLLHGTPIAVYFPGGTIFWLNILIV